MTKPLSITIPGFYFNQQTAGRVRQALANVGISGLEDAVKTVEAQRGTTPTTELSDSQITKRAEYTPTDRQY
jgi:hypothetical protein